VRLTLEAEIPELKDLQAQITKLKIALELALCKRRAWLRFERMGIRKCSSEHALFFFFDKVTQFLEALRVLLICVWLMPFVLTDFIFLSLCYFNVLSYSTV
jgi:hypothetical protein